jgi:hypothetical protein
MRRLDDTGANFIPLHLPCGKEINQNYEPGMTLQCCKTECPEKSNDQIEQCYDKHKYGHVRERKPVILGYGA